MIDITSERAGAFMRALQLAEPGDKIIYARGVTCGGQHKRAAMDACERGLVTLVQKRNGEADFSYIAIKLKGAL